MLKFLFSCKSTCYPSLEAISLCSVSSSVLPINFWFQNKVCLSFLLCKYYCHCKCEIQLEVLWPGFLVVKISSFNCPCELATDNSQCYDKIVQTFFSHRHSKHLRCKYKSTFASVHCMRSASCRGISVK